MRIFRYTKTALSSAVELTSLDADRPEPGPGHVRVRMEAASVNYRDLLMQAAVGRGDMAERIPLSDGAGVVDAVGAGSRRWEVGSRVMMSFFPPWTQGRYRMTYANSGLGGPERDGVLADYIVVSEDALVCIPESLSFEEAACFPCAAVTAWNGLVVRAGLKRGNSVLILGTGGVALFAVQIAVALGAHVIIASSSNDKLARAKAMGVSTLINYRERPDWDAGVMAATDGRGVTHVLELGGP